MPDQRISVKAFRSLATLPHPRSVQEKGWDVDQTIEKLLKNGTRISAEAHEIVRIPGLLTDADMIGEVVASVLQRKGARSLLGCSHGQPNPWTSQLLRQPLLLAWRTSPLPSLLPTALHPCLAGDIVWAYDRAAGCWWPAEKLDPLNMPAGGLHRWATGVWADRQERAKLQARIPAACCRVGNPLLHPRLPQAATCRQARCVR